MTLTIILVSFSEVKVRSFLEVGQGFRESFIQRNVRISFYDLCRYTGSVYGIHNRGCTFLLCVFTFKMFFPVFSFCFLACNKCDIKAVRLERKEHFVRMHAK